MALTNMITIIDYGMGNIRSVVNAFEALGEKISIADNPSKLHEAKAIVIPGVGAFGAGMENLRKRNFIPALNSEVIDNKKPYLGICLGLEFLAEKSFEHGTHYGLGWIKGAMRKIEPKDQNLKIPHMGWNDIKILKKSVLFEGLSNPVFYFVHSYIFEVGKEDTETISSTCWHGEEIVASIQKDNIFATQFHPEKSQRTGLKLLENFINYINSGKSEQND